MAAQPEAGDTLAPPYFVAVFLPCPWVFDVSQALERNLDDLKRFLIAAAVFELLVPAKEPSYEARVYASSPLPPDHPPVVI